MTQLLNSEPAQAPSPLLTTTLSLPGRDADTWVVVDSTVGGLAMGGTRMTTTVDPGELASLARAMTHKPALVDVPIGGRRPASAPAAPSATATPSCAPSAR